MPIRNSARVSLTCLTIFLLSACGNDDADLPGLRSLEVVGASGTMFPAFDSKTTHYGVRCDSSDVLQVTAKATNQFQTVAADGFLGSLAELSFEVANPDDAEDIAVTVSSGGLSEVYTLHCIASDVPDTGITVATQEASDGLLFLTPQFSESQVRKTFLLILDNNGVPRFQRKIDGRAVDFKVHPNGLYTYALGIGRNEFGLGDFVIIVLDESFQEIDQLTTVGLNHTDNHDFIFTPEGTQIFISYDSSIRDMTAFGLSAEEVVGDSVIQEVDADGNVLFEWNSWDHIDLNDCRQTGYPRFPADYAHLNAVTLTSDGDLVGSFRGCGQVIKIDRSSGDVVWFLGGSKSDFLVTGDPFGEFCGQHTAQQLDNGNVLLFDNGSYCLGDRETQFGQFSRAVEYSLDLETGQAMFVRDYGLNGSYEAFTASQGSVQPMSNGNWLIGWGSGPETSVTEINEAGETVFEMQLTVAGEVVVSYRAFRED